MAVGKIVVTGISIILVVGIALAVVAVVHHNEKQGETGGSGVSAESKMVETICTNTDYKAACRDSLNPVAKNSSADYKDFIKAAMLTTVAQVSKSLNLTESLLVESNTSNPRLKMSLEDCNDLLSLAVEQLQASFSMVGDRDLHTVQDRSDELKSWLSSVITYAETCIDGVPEPTIQDKMKDTVRNATALTDNALAIISEMSKILELFGLQINAKPLNSRRLLSDDGFPTWLSASDRKLLQVNNGKIAPNAVVAKDGSGQFKTIAAALAAYPKNHQGRYVIYVKAGVYDEYITVDKKMVNVLMYGDGPRKTIVTGRKSYTGGYSTFRTASFCKYY